MKLAEALIERATLVTKYGELKERITRNALVQEGEVPAEDPSALLDEAKQVLIRLACLIDDINETNAATTVTWGERAMSLTMALAFRDTLRMHHALLKETVEAATGSGDLFRRTRAEIKQTPALSVADVQRKADEVAKNLRDLEVVIQQANWQTDLRE